MLLINYIRWMRRWRVNWQADNWREESSEAYDYLIEWHSDKRKPDIGTAIKIAKAKQEYRRYAQRAKLLPRRKEADYTAHPAYRMVAEIDKLVYEIVGVHVVYVSHRDGFDYCMVDCCIGKNGRDKWLEPVMHKFPLVAMPTLIQVSYETITREPLYFSFRWLTHLPTEEIQQRIARDIAYGWQRKEDEFQVNRQLKTLTSSEKQALRVLAQDYHIELDPYVSDYRQRRMYEALADKGLCEMALNGRAVIANDKTRMIAQATE